MSLRDWTVLGLDPGTNSFAYCVMRVTAATPASVRFKVVQHGMLHSTMRSLTSPSELREQRLSYQACLDQIMAAHAITHVIGERYMLRRGQGGSAIESINMMLGILLMRNVATKLIPAAQWKNQVARCGIALDALYSEGKPSRLTPHQIDATHIAAFGFNTLLKRKPHVYQNLVRQLLAMPPTHLGESTKPPPKRKKRARKAK